MPQTYLPLDWYQTPLYYDIIFDADTRKEARFVEELYHRYVPLGDKRLLEPACGSGRLMAELARRGFAVSGFDVSAPMLDFARTRFKRRGVSGDLSKQRLEDFHYAQKFDLAYCFVSTFKYLLTEEAARAHLERVAKHLDRGGVYILGFHLTDYDRTSQERERWVAGRGATRVVCNIQSWRPDRKARTERVRSRLNVETRAAGIQRFETEWLFRTYDNGQFRRLLRKVPSLKLVATHDFFYQPEQSLDFDRETDGVVVVLQRQ